LLSTSSTKRQVKFFSLNGFIDVNSFVYIWDLDEQDLKSYLFCRNIKKNNFRGKKSMSHVEIIHLLLFFINSNYENSNLLVAYSSGCSHQITVR